MSTSRPPRGWNDRALIPNRDGYRVRLLLSNGVVEDDVVCRGEDGIHRLRGTEVSEVLGWQAV